MAVRLGYLALLPFVVGAAAVLITRGAAQDHAAAALSAYAATVVSFLGGIHWGFGFRTSEPPASLFLWGVVPSLAAWAGLQLPMAAALALHAAVLSACFLVDCAVYPRQDAAGWLPLRSRLTAIAVLSCLLGALGVLHAR
ncbi:MAG: DUF3429 domain-containing protein [Caldimonas sp.]